MVAYSDGWQGGVCHPMTETSGTGETSTFYTEGQSDDWKQVEDQWKRTVLQELRVANSKVMILKILVAVLGIAILVITL